MPSGTTRLLCHSPNVGNDADSMSIQDAIGALERLGFSNYAARVFVALQQLGTGTAEAISDVSVPRSQVYGVADDLAVRGLVEVTETTPQQYRPRSLLASTA